MSNYDYIICGGGCSGLSLAYRLLSEEFRNSKILIIDKDRKNKNDRTWSFWTTDEEDIFAEIYAKTWHRLAFYSPNLELETDPFPYKYNTIHGVDFYQFVLDKINASDHIHFLNAEIYDQKEVADTVVITTSEGEFQAQYCFDSIVRSFPENKKLFVWQHFLGWEVEYDKDTFNDDVATFMDFRIEQNGETIFVYVLPFSKTSALVEATFFSKEILKPKVYEDILDPYVKTYFGSNFQIINKEAGAIPMTTEPFSKGSKRIIPIGTNNGTVKPSTGYAFTRIQKECNHLIEGIKKRKIEKVQPRKRFLAYDRTLLNVLITGKESGQKVFTMLFKNNKFNKILKFLNEDTSIFEEIAIFNTLPFASFLRAFTKENVLTFTKSKR